MQNKKLKKYLIRFVSDFFYVGNVPFAPGTFGTAAAVLPVYVLSLFFYWKICAFFLLIVCFFAGRYASKAIENEYGVKDPSHIVIDEAVGFYTGMLFLSAFNMKGIIALFLLFRFFDITKLFPIKYVEKYGNGWGVMLDDIIAGIYSGFVVLLLKFGGVL